MKKKSEASSYEFSWLQGPLFTVVCCVISFSYKLQVGATKVKVCAISLVWCTYTLNLLTLDLAWDSLATQSIACGGLKIRQPATIYCHCQVNLLLQHYYHAQHGVSFSNDLFCLVFKFWNCCYKWLAR